MNNTLFLRELIPSIAILFYILIVYSIFIEIFNLKSFTARGIVLGTTTLFISALSNTLKKVYRRKRNKVSKETFVYCNGIIFLSLLAVVLLRKDEAIDFRVIGSLLLWCSLLFVTRLFFISTEVTKRKTGNLLNTFILVFIVITQTLFMNIDKGSFTIINIFSWIIIISTISFYVKDVYSSLKVSFLSHYVGAFYGVSVYVFTEIIIMKESLLGIGSVVGESLILTTAVIALFCYVNEKVFRVSETIKTRTMFRNNLYFSMMLTLTRVVCWSL